jgi:asparagine synthase (glutamine-hydrolysing)
VAGPAATSVVRFERLAGAMAGGPPALRLDGRLDNRGALLADAPPGERELDDAALLLARYHRLGEAFLDDVRGAFALALVDPARPLALAARDGMGNRAASYVLRREVFAVAVGPESGGAPALLELPGVSAELDAGRLAEYFAFDEVTTSASFFRDVRHLLPGEMLIVEPRAVRRRSLPRPRLDPRGEPASWEEVVESFSVLLRQSVERVLRGHQRAAVWVSGGLDSTPIAAHAARLLPGVAGESALAAVCWRVSDPAADDAPFVAEFSAHSGVPVAWVDCDDALVFADLARWPSHPASPEQTAYRWFHERSYARSRELGATLVLTGFSGDQLFLDARRWFWTLLLADGPGRAIDRLREVAERDGWPRTVRSEVVGALLPRRRRLRRSLPAWLTPAARSVLADRRPWPPDVARARRPRQAERTLALLEAHGEHLEAWYAGRHGLALAAPLRDFDLVQLLLAVPDHFLRQGVQTRPIVRAAIRGLVPETVRWRAGKASFREVLLRGLERQRLGFAPALLRSPQALWRGHVEAAAVERWLAGEVADDWARIGLLQCLFAELWRFTREGGDPAALTASSMS